jgi:hypothetical protein
MVTGYYSTVLLLQEVVKPRTNYLCNRLKSVKQADKQNINIHFVL